MKNAQNTVKMNMISDTTKKKKYIKPLISERLVSDLELVAAHAHAHRHQQQQLVKR